jgi:prophage DNA circulation protein
MAWQDQLQPASFRGAAFSSVSSGAAFGRRGTVHEYPLRDTPWFEDLGRMARKFTVEGVVLGPDYMAARNALIAAIEAPGPGELVHHYYGIMQVAVTDCQVHESTDAGGVARFTISFVEAGKSTYPKPAASTPDLVAAKAEPASSTGQAAFATGVKTKGLPDFVATSMRTRVASLLATVRATAATVATVTAPLAQLQQQIDDINGNLVALAYEPAAMAQSLVATLVQLVRSVAVEPAQAIGLARVFWRFGPVSVSTANVSPRRAVEINNRILLSRLVRTTALAESARAAAGLGFDSYDAAVALRDGLTDAIDELLLVTTDDTAFDALRTMRAAVVADITARGADLSRLVRYTPGATMPVLVLAQRLYSDVTQAGDVLARNVGRIAHPLFVQGGLALEVLADD